MDTLPKALSEKFVVLFSPTPLDRNATQYDIGVEAHKHQTRIVLDTLYPRLIPWKFR